MPGPGTILGQSTAWPFLPQLLQPLRKVRFKTPDDTEVTFDANGDLVSKFDIVRGQKTPEGSFHLVHVGQIDPRGSSGSSMTVHLQENLQVSLPGTWNGVLEHWSWREPRRPGSLSPAHA